MSFSQLNFGQLLHELNNVDTRHKIRFYEKIKKRILLTNYCGVVPHVTSLPLITIKPLRHPIS